MERSGLIALPRPTNHTVKGPCLDFEAPTLALKYDYQVDDGTIEWHTVIFDEVLAFSCLQSVCCDVEHNVDWNSVTSFSNSEWLTKILSKWSDAVGWQEFQKRKGGKERFNHFRVYFDDVACVDVIASVCEIFTPQPDSASKCPSGVRIIPPPESGKGPFG